MDDIDVFLQKRARTQPERRDDVLIKKALHGQLRHVNPLRARLSAFTLKQLAREKKRAEGNKVCPKGTQHYQYKRRRRREVQHAYDDTLKRKWNRLINNSKQRGIAGPHMTKNEYVKLFVELVPWVSVDGKAVPPSSLIDKGGVHLRRLDLSRGFTLDNVQVLKGKHVLWRGTNTTS